MNPRGLRPCPQRAAAVSAAPRASSGGFLRLGRRLPPRVRGRRPGVRPGVGLEETPALVGAAGGAGSHPRPAGASGETRCLRNDYGTANIRHRSASRSARPGPSPPLLLQYSGSVRPFLEGFLKKNTILLSSWLSGATQALTGSSQGIRRVSI